jgi:hypothetical protein
MYYEKVILSISAMLFVGAASMRNWAQYWSKFKFGRSNRNFTNAQVIKLEPHRVQRSNKRSTTMMFVYQGVNPGQIIVSGNNTSAKKHGRRRSKGNDNVHSQNNWDNKATKKTSW